MFGIVSDICLLLQSVDYNLDTVRLRAVQCDPGVIAFDRHLWAAGRVARQLA